MKFLSKAMLSASSKVIFALNVFLVLHTIEVTASNGTIPALFAFGDSILDTGNNNNLNTFSKCNFPPYGRDFPGHIATGRFGNGKVFSDIISEGLGIKDLLPAYLDPTLQSTDLPTGVCFASGGSGLDELTARVQNILSRTDQFKKFQEYVGKLEGVVGYEKAKDIISNALFLFSAGNNDLAINYFSLRLRREYDINSYTSLLVSWASSLIKDLYGLGARRFAFMSTLPLGCLPAARIALGGLCTEIVNQAAMLFNSKLESDINNLKGSLPGAKLVFVDVYNPLLQLIQNPHESGFDVATRGCCGSGVAEICSRLTLVTCSDPSNYVFWDSAHPSEKAYRTIVPEVLQKYQSGF
ncbi:hypothetical protein SLEP1_g28279 [Rubroshorea leprosula]|uniref:Uncharacterized protein n=2 Tax=Rubroshorea leprosula TaxID=152421 RepID=A0AAV5K2I6_9ROSI|nr:hypothetical protein SLEP1_g28279 [Rubroshorea leprosula]